LVAGASSQENKKFSSWARQRRLSRALEGGWAGPSAGGKALGNSSPAKRNSQAAVVGRPVHWHERGDNGDRTEFHQTGRLTKPTNSGLLTTDTTKNVRQRKTEEAKNKTRSKEDRYEQEVSKKRRQKKLKRGKRVL